MSLPRVLVVSATFHADDHSARLLASKGFELLWRHDLAHAAAPDDLVAALDGVWAVIAGSEHYSAEVLDRAPTLRAIARPGVGFDAIDVDAASRLGIAVLITRGANDESVADHTLALILAGLRRLVELDRRTRTGSWRPSEVGHELFGSTVGIVGLGAIGRAVGRRLAGFDCRLLAVEPQPDAAFCRRYGVEVMSLDLLLPQVDVLTVHVPLTPQTRGLIGARELGLLSPHALVVNTARGGIIDEAALVAALAERLIGAAALDVFEREPFLADDPLAGLPSVTLSPHHAAFTLEAIQRMVAATIDNLVAVAAGTLPPGCVNGAELEVGPRAAASSAVT